MKSKASYKLEIQHNGKNAYEPAKMFIQYAGACSASVAAFSVGTILAWTSPATPHIQNAAEMGFNVSKNELAWIGGLMPLGSALSCVPAGYSTDMFGRKATLLSLVPLFLLGWALIIWASSLVMLYAGRFISGMCGGAVCIVAPTFAAEICLKEIRGVLGTFYQLLLASGILFTYVVGSFLNAFWLSIVCAVFPILFGISFLFFPDTPVYYLTKGRPEEARKSLRFFRGDNYDLEAELSELAEGCKRKEKDEEGFWEAFSTKQAIRSTFFCVGMMIFQQLSGVNSVIFYTVDIFKDAGSSIDPFYATILVGIMEVVSTLAVAFVIERYGRRILLIISAAVMFLCTLAIGVFFYLKTHQYDISHLGWLPLLSLCVFIVMFSIGYGPIPWAMMPEILPSRIKGTASSLAGVINWLCAFLVTKFFTNLSESIGTDGTFWLFSAVSLIGVFFSWHLPETKGKTFEEIQLELAGKSKMNNNFTPRMMTIAR